ncbi:uncharacterized protein P884DRAFT_252357 [Thermothelomyces heterothallicus CBS 202.75]|uniref:uncharacterized protein n=1 Tax=Thermothelomyces heterothallicus CBS 202.75 TaxID=1149848 RepID=UPI0037441C2A
MQRAFISELVRRNQYNLRMLRQAPLAEISGALGDLGTLLPLMIALALQGSIDLPSTLIFSGLFNMVTGAVFAIPLPVQPMKAIAASAISTHLSLRTTTAAGALVSVAVLVLSISGALRLLTARIPVPVVKGIQLGAALRLVSSGASLILPLPWLAAAAPLDSRLAVLAAFLLLFLTQRAPRFPYALILFLLGLLAALSAAEPPAALVSTHHHHHHQQQQQQDRHQHPGPLRFYLPGFASPAAWTAALSQLPLTTLNSVVAVSALAADLVGASSSTTGTPPPPPPPPPGVTALGLSVAAMNLVGCWAGAMPVCHGAGGLAAQVRFGARSGASVVLLGLAKLALGLVSGVVGVLQRFPRGALGVMVVAAGLELGKVGAGFDRVWRAGDEDGDAAAAAAAVEERRGKEREERWMVMMVTAAGTLAFKNDAVGFLAGCCCHAAYKIADWTERRRVWEVAGERRPLLW